MLYKYKHSGVALCSEGYKGTCASVVGSSWIMLLWLCTYILQDLIVLFCQRLDLMMLEDFSNLSDSVIHFTWDFLFLVLPHCHCPAWCSALGTCIYTHALTHRRELKPILLSILFFCSLSVVLAEAWHAATPLWRVALGAVLSRPPASCLGLLLCHMKWCAWAGAGGREMKSQGSNYVAKSSFRKTMKKQPNKTNQSKMSEWHWWLLLSSLWAFLSSWCSGINSFVCCCGWFITCYLQH